MRFWAAAFLMLFSLAARSQSIFYQHDTSVHVIAYGNQQLLPWCGGFNNSQFTMGDLNNDGLQDLVAFDPWLGIRTFINKGTLGHPRYSYAPEYALNFPPLYDYLVLADYNCDGIPDLFHRGGVGYEVFTGHFNSLNELCFTFKQDIYYTNLVAGGPSNAYVNPGDIPSIIDVDGDGDPDLVSYDVNGQSIYYYRNMRVEKGLSCDSLEFHLTDQCWGKVKQQFWREHTLPYNCDESNLILPRHARDAEKTTHSGNTPCVFDWDMDGDMDYLDGSISFPNMTFLKNGRVEMGLGRDSMVSQDTMWQSYPGGTLVNLPMWPAAFNVDIDQDGKKDLLISPNASQGSENYKCVWYYKNNSTPGTPSWQFESDTFLVDQTIDVGTAAYPVLFDFDQDGKPDLFVGSDGYFQPGGTLKSRISYYHNTSVPGNPSFTLVTKDFLGLSGLNYVGAAPAFGDLDGDGKTDMVIGHTDGTISFFRNMAGSAGSTPILVPAETKMIDNYTLDTINTGGYAAPFIYDVDHDGKPDLVLGNVYGQFMYFQNLCTVSGSPNLKLVNEVLGQAQVDPATTFPNYSTPYIGKVDSTGTDYLLSGSNSGNIYRFGGIASGDTAATYSLLDANYSYIDSDFNYYNQPGYGVYMNLRTALTVGDIAGDGGKEMIVGNIRGGLDMYKLKIYFPEDTNNQPKREQTTVKIFPNPANESVNVYWLNTDAASVTVSIVNMEGQRLYTRTLANSYHNVTIPVGDLPNGVYVCEVLAGSTRVYQKVTIMR